VADQPVLAPAVDDHAGRIDRVEPLLGERPLGADQLRRDGTHARLGQPAQGGLGEPRREEGVRLHEEQRVALYLAQAPVHRLAERVPLIQAHAAYAELGGHLGGGVFAAVVEHGHVEFYALLVEERGQRLAQEGALARGDDGDADLHSAFLLLRWPKSARPL
jgi:hypothetical protein